MNRKKVKINVCKWFKLAEISVVVFFSANAFYPSVVPYIQKCKHKCNDCFLFALVVLFSIAKLVCWCPSFSIVDLCSLPLNFRFFLALHIFLICTQKTILIFLFYLFRLTGYLKQSLFYTQPKNWNIFLSFGCTHCYWCAHFFGIGECVCFHICFFFSLCVLFIFFVSSIFCRSKFAFHALLCSLNYGWLVCF